MTTEANRPALAEVLAALSECPIDTVRGWLRGCDQQRMRPAIEATETGGAGLCVRGYFADGTRGWLFPLRDATPAEALAALVEAEAIPEHWLDAARAPRWWALGRCGMCGGRGGPAGECAYCGPDGMAACDLSLPPSHAALVAVASLGAASLARAEAIVAETWPVARLVWRAMTAEALREHHGRRAFAASASPRAEEAFSWEAHIAERDSRPWREECPFGEEWGAEIRRTWPASTALRAIGVHLLAVEDGRVVLAVEALS
jgi:hypothetical protein